MKVVDTVKVPNETVTGPGVQKVKMRALVTQDEGAPNFTMRLFEVESGGTTPLHAHPWEHEIFVVEGRMEALENGETVRNLKTGDAVYVPANEKHQFRNPGPGVLKMICMVPNHGHAGYKPKNCDA
ncbi:MAG TPA: cupin domain-containing protein [Planctomycetota bacterium]|nr:cupin domain-containing protein [Planctomycetota bacterium]